MPIRDLEALDKFDFPAKVLLMIKDRMILVAVGSADKILVALNLVEIKNS
jgi:hypothetical protein